MSNIFHGQHCACTVPRCWNTELNKLEETNKKQLSDVLSDASRPLCSVYGAIVGLLAFGLNVSCDVLDFLHVTRRIEMLIFSTGWNYVVDKICCHLFIPFPYTFLSNLNYRQNLRKIIGWCSEYNKISVGVTCLQNDET